MTEQTAKPTLPPIKGSWEDLAQQAARLASTQNDEAIPLYEKLISRLRALPEATRLANQGRLQAIFRNAAINFHTYLTVRERYDAALDLIPLIEAIEGDAKREAWQYHKASVLYQAGRFDEAIAQLRARVETPADFPTVHWGQLAMMHVHIGQPEAGAQVLDEAVQWLEQKVASGEKSAAQGDEDRALLASLQAQVALERHDLAGAINYYERAILLDPYYDENLAILYIRMAQHGYAEAALPFILRDKQHAIRAGFWHGFVLKQLGKPTEAQRHWEKIAASDLAKTQERSLMEFVLAHYYLGDPKGEALGGILRLLKEDRGASWELLFLAGLGWGLRGNLQDARANLSVAVTRRKAMADGGKLSYESWIHAKALLSEEVQSQLSGYFETE